MSRPKGTSNAAPYSAESRAKFRAAKLGKPKRPEHRSAIREAVKQWWARRPAMSAAQRAYCAKLRRCGFCAGEARRLALQLAE